MSLGDEFHANPCGAPVRPPLRCALNREITSWHKSGTVGGMPLTADQIVEETAQWPVDAVSELLDRIALAKHGGMDAARENAWTEAALRRSAELDSGKVALIPGDIASERIRKIVGR